jgi:outer membrane protein insertion porin family
MHHAVLVLAALASAAPLVSAAPLLQDGAPPNELQLPPAPNVQPRPNDSTVKSFTVVGAERYDRESLRESLGIRIGEPLDAAAVERIDRGVATLFSTGLLADVEFRKVDGGYELRLVVQELPLDLAPRFVGNERVELETVLEWAGLREGDEVRLNQSEAIAFRLEERYRQEGYAFAAVEAVLGEFVPGEGERPPAQDVIFSIDEGPRVRVSRVHIEGNDSLPDTGFWPWRSGLRHEAEPKLRKPIMGWLFGSLFSVPYREDRLREDLVAMREAYRALGWLDAVVELERLEFTRDRRWVTVHVRVDEGEPYRVTSLRIEGFERRPDPADTRGTVDVPAELLVPESELLELCRLRAGDVVTRYEIDLDERAFEERYGEMGHVAHDSIPAPERFEFLEPHFVFDETRNEVAVTYRLAQGRKQSLREILFSGNARTQDRVLRREMGEVFEGEVADLPQIERGVARLRGSGYFSSVTRAIDHREPTFRFREVQNPDGSPNQDWKDLEVLVEEGDQLRFDFGVVYGTDNGFAGQIGLTFQNFDATRWPSLDHPIDDITSGNAFRGAGQTLRLFASPGTDFSRYQILFTEPDLFGRHLDRIGSTIDFSRGFRGYRTHEEQRDEIGLSLFQQLDADTRLSLGFRTADIEVSDLALGAPSLLDPLGVPDLLAAQLGQTQVSGLELSLSRRILDNAIAPRDGYSASAQVSVYDSLLGSDFDYAGLEARYDLYGSLFDYEEEEVHPGYRLRFAAATLVPYGDTDNVPYTERMFLGGSRLLRGFAFRGVGPNERSHPIGGESMLTASAEYLWPLLSQSIPGTTRRIEVFRGGFFLDAGILDVEPFRADLDELRVSAGITVGMVQPLPLALNFGFPLVDDEGDRRRTFSFSLQF